MTGNHIIPLSFGGQSVRGAEADDVAMFVAEDVCNALGITKHRDAISKLDDDERGSLEVDTLGGRQVVAALTEAGVYTLALRCRDAMKPGTAPYAFRKWVTGVALPALRRGHEVHALNLSQSDRSAIGGIIKGVVHKEIATLLPALIEQQIMAGRYSVVEGVSALEVAEMAGYTAGKRPRGASQFITRRLGRYHEDRAVPIRRSRHGSGKVRLFDEATSRDWLKRGGGAEIDQYIAQRKGQGALRLIQS